MARRIKSGDDTVQTIALPAPLGRVNDPATCRRILRRSGTAAAYLHDFKTTARIASHGGGRPLNEARGCLPSENGGRHGWGGRKFGGAGGARAASTAVGRATPW